MLQDMLNSIGYISIHAPHARSDHCEKICNAVQISIHAPHARSDSIPAEQAGDYKISIHAPHARSDNIQRYTARGIPAISIHAPHARSDLAALILLFKALYFNPRSSCEERLVQDIHHELFDVISIHAPHARSDACEFACGLAMSEFQSTLLMRGATKPFVPKDVQRLISIHAPHARSDCSRRCLPILSRHFNPRSSCEERLED